MDLFEDEPTAPGNAPELTVSDLTGAVKKTLEGAFGRVRVRGEVGRVVVARTGHMYFDLKDDRNVIAAVSWKGQVARLTHRPEEGMEVIATGRLTTYGPQSRYQLNVEDVTPAGAGALMAMLEKRKAKLAAEGLFAAERKRALPFLPDVIGVITSPTGAVIRDILHRFRDRFPRTVIVWPVAVQGQHSATQVAAAIEGFNRIEKGGAVPRPDLLIVARGGGSLEDLWGFNEEIVARAAAASGIPLISAVGHETDTTLIDFVSDWRAPTPTAAAERAVPVRLDLLAGIEQLGARATRSVSGVVSLRRQRLTDLSRALPSAGSLLAQPTQRLDLASTRLPSGLRSLASAKRESYARIAGPLRPALVRARVAQSGERLATLSDRLNRGLRVQSERQRDKQAQARRRSDELAERMNTAFHAVLDARRKSAMALDRLRVGLGYEKTLERGFAVVYGDGAVVTTSVEAARAATLEIEFSDGRMSPQKPTRSKPTEAPPDQGSLF